VGDEAQKMLSDLIGQRKTAPFDPERSLLVDGYEVIARKFLDTRGRESEGHYGENGIGRLAHLAELAVGEGTEREYSTRAGKSDAWRSIGGQEGLDSLVRQQGYLSALQILLQS
jgi:hypothetical protein